MIYGYINYPNPHVTAHLDISCGKVRSQSKEDQRFLLINAQTVVQELVKFRAKAYRFGTHPYNDMWLEIDFQDQDFELLVLGYVTNILGMFYGPFSAIKPVICCGADLNNNM